VKIHFTKS